MDTLLLALLGLGACDNDEITRYFLDTERSIYAKQARLGGSRTALDHYRLAPENNPYPKPIVLFTSNTTASVAEVFALMVGITLNISNLKPILTRTLCLTQERNRTLCRLRPPFF